MNANSPHEANAVAADVDSTIDRALSALRDAAPRPGLEGRILSSLEHRATTPQSTRFHFSAHVALWTAASAAILAVTSLAILRHHSTRMESAQVPENPVVRGVPSPSGTNQNAVILSEQSESKNPDVARRASNSEPFSTTNLAPLTQTVSSRPGHRSLAAMRNGGTCISGHPDCSIHADDVTSSTPTDAQALADLHAPSHPAPPLRLTPQERLFLSVLRYGNLTQLAELNPIVRAEHDADETADFKAFFPDPPPLHQPGDPE